MEIDGSGKLYLKLIPVMKWRLRRRQQKRGMESFKSRFYRKNKHFDFDP